MDFVQIKRFAAFSAPKDEKQAAAIKRYLRIGGLYLWCRS
jgi:hypothetical protein